jgi:hypothetical protein
VVALLAAMGAMLVGPSQTQQRTLELHYRKMQADYLSLGGLEQAKEWAAQGVLTNELFVLSNGVVDTTMEALDGKRCRVVSIGRVRVGWKKDQITARNELIVPLGRTD